LLYCQPKKKGSTGFILAGGAGAVARGGEKKRMGCVKQGSCQYPIWEEVGLLGGGKKGSRFDKKGTTYFISGKGVF